MKYQEESTKVSIVSVSRRAAPPQLGQSTGTQSSAGANAELPFGREAGVWGGAALRDVVGVVGQQDGQVLLPDRHESATLAVDDRDGAAPVALARDEPVA